MESFMSFLECIMLNIPEALETDNEKANIHILKFPELLTEHEKSEKLQDKIMSENILEKITSHINPFKVQDSEENCQRDKDFNVNNFFSKLAKDSEKRREERVK